MKEKTLTLLNRSQWRNWLKRNHSKEAEVWLIYYKKHTGKPTIPYNDAVEEAICFGWIDSLVRRIDDERYMQKYTPRKEKSIWSKTNKARVNRMVKQGLMTDAGMRLVTIAKKNGEWDKATLSGEKPSMPEDLETALAKNKKADTNFKAFAPSYQNMYIHWINSAKREATRAKRITEVVNRSAKNIKSGM